MMMKVKKDCVCEHDSHETLSHYREGLKIKKLRKGDKVKFIEEFRNCYGTYCRVEKDGETFDLLPEDLEPEEISRDV